MAYKLYLVGFTWIKSPIKTEGLEPVFSGLGDWLRFSAHSWLVFTEHPAQVIYEQLRTHMHTEDSVLIVEVNPGNHFGWEPKWIWDWLNAKQAILSAGSGIAAANPYSYFGGLAALGQAYGNNPAGGTGIFPPFKKP